MKFRLIAQHHSIFFPGVLGFLQVQWLRCQLTDEYVWTNAEGHIESNNSYRDAVLQFDNSGNSALLSDSITFLVAGESDPWSLNSKTMFILSLLYPPITLCVLH